MRTLLPLLLLVGCTKKDLQKFETSVSELIVSDDQQKSLGKQMHQELLNSGVKLHEDAEVNAYVTSIAEKVAKTVNKQEEVEGLKVYVIDDKKTVNAMATPGGYVYVYTGLLVAAKDEAEVAGVVGHEIGHVVARHVARQMVVQYGAEMVLALALGEKPDQLAEIAGQVAATGVLLAHSRADEEEADKLGLLYLHKAGWDTTGITRFFETLKGKSSDSPEFLAWFSTHPSTDSRIETLSALIKERGYTGGDTGADEHAAIVAKLK